MSRLLKPTRPVSSLLIFEPEARMAYPASSSVIRFPSRRRRSWAPSMMRRAVGPPPGEAIMSRTAAPFSGRRMVTRILLGRPEDDIVPPPGRFAPNPWTTPARPRPAFTADGQAPTPPAGPGQPTARVGAHDTGPAARVPAAPPGWHSRLFTQSLPEPLMQSQ